MMKEGELGWVESLMDVVLKVELPSPASVVGGSRNVGVGFWDFNHVVE